MTVLTLASFDPDRPGSHAERMSLMDLAADWEEAQQNNSIKAMAAIARRIEALVLARLRTDDGSDPAEALRNCSATDYNALVAHLTDSATADSTPLPNTAS